MHLTLIHDQRQLRHVWLQDHPAGAADCSLAAGAAVASQGMHLHCQGRCSDGKDCPVPATLGDFAAGTANQSRPRLISCW